MKEVNFKKIGFKNFCCYGDELFEIEIQNNKLILIHGPNGVGKTTIFDSIPFTLFGMTSKGIRGKSAINNRTQKNCYTYVDFDIDDTHYKAERYYGHTKHGDTAYLTRDGVLYKRGSQEVVNEVEKILTSKKLFFSTLLFGQKNKTFFTELSDTDQKEIFRKILKLDDYVTYNKKTSEFIDIIQRELIEIENQNSAKIYIIENLKSHIILLNKEKDEFEKSKENKVIEYESDIIRLNSHIVSLNYDLSELNDSEINIKLELVNDRLSNHNRQLSELDSQLNDIIEQIKIKTQNKQYEMDSIRSQKRVKLTEDYNTQLSLLNEQLNTIRSDKKLDETSVNSEITSIENLIKFSKSTIENLNEERQKFFDNIFRNTVSVCPTCQQVISQEVKTKLNQHIESLKDKIKNIENENKEHRLKIESLKKDWLKRAEDSGNQFSIIKNDVDKLKSIFNSDINELDLKFKTSLQELQKLAKEAINNKTQNIKKQKEELIEKIKSFESEKSMLNREILKIQELKNQIISTESDIKKYRELIEITKSEKYDDSRLKSCYKKIKETSIEIENLKSKNIELKKKHDILLFWKEAFSKSGIESMLIDESIPFMNERIAQYLNDISFGRYIVTFDTLKKLKNDEYCDKISLNVLDNITLSNSRDNFSAGQIRILDIAIILTLCDLQSSVQDIKFNLLLFDEIFDTLDDENIYRVSKVLKNLTRNKCVFLISHRHIDQIETDEELKL